MSVPDSPVADDIETDPSEDEEEVEEEIEEEEEVEEEVEEEEIEEEVEEEDVEEEVEEEEVEEVEEEEVEEEEVEEVEEEVEEEEEVEGMEVEEEEDEDEEQEVEEVELEEEVEEVEEEEEEEEGDREVEQEEEGGEQKAEKVKEEVEEEEGEEEKQEEEAVKKEKEEQEKKQQEKQQEEAMEEKEGEQRQQEKVGEDKSAVPGSPPDADKDRRDLSQHMESEEQHKNLGPDSFVAENPEVMPPSSVHCMEENDAMLKTSVPSCQILTLKKEELPLKYDISSDPKSRENLTSVEDGKSQGLDVESAGSLLQKETLGGFSEPGCNSKADLCDDKDVNSGARAIKSSSETGQDMVIGLLPKDCLVADANGGQNCRNKITQLEMESRDDVKQMPSRTRSASPSADIKKGNKRPKIICDFFAKGWCIRGSSCSFLHIKDTVDKTDQEAEADLVPAHQKRELKVEEGVRENVQRSRMNEQEVIPSWHQPQEKKNFKLRDNLFPENRFAFSSTNNYFSPNQDEMATLRNQHMHKGYASTCLSHSPNSSLVSQFPASSMSLSHRISAQPGCSLPFSSPLGSSNVNSQNLLNADKEYLTSKSNFSCSGREEFPLVSSSRVPSYPTGYKSKICSYDWEPSVPFRPSFFITSMNVSSSAGDLYDPLRDSIEIPNIGDGSLKASLLIQGSNMHASSQVRIYGNSDVVGKHMSSLNDDKSSVSSHNKFNENEPNKNSVPHEKDYLPTETEITSGTYVNHQNGKMGMGQNSFGIGDSTKKERDMTEHDARRHSEGSGHKTKRVDRDKKNHEMDIDFQMDGSTQKESKALKMLRAALVDHVKELLKPAWHEGRLSKDAHIMIVRKSVDKVVSTIEPHQIPTIDTAKQYVSSSRVKIAKLVNGYVNKYGKY